jgi:carboxylesterase
MSVISPLANAVAPKALHLKGGRHGVLLFHGLSSGPLELQFLGRGIQRAGYTVRIPVIDGYSYGLKTKAPVKVEQWLASAKQELDQLLTECDTVSVGGLCVGAVMALRLASLEPQKISQVLSLSAALHFDGWGNPWFTPFLSWAQYVPFAGRIAIQEQHPFGLKDERMRAWVERQMKEMGASTAGASVLRVADLLKARELAIQVRQSLQNITCPTLLIHAKEDECAKPRSSFEVASKVKSSRVRCVLLSDSYHMISIDREKALVLSEMLQFLASCIVNINTTLVHDDAQVQSLQRVPQREFS